MIETINKQHETISKQQANREKRLILRHLKGASDPFVLFCFKCWQRPQHDQSDGAVFNVNKSQSQSNSCVSELLVHWATKPNCLEKLPLKLYQRNCFLFARPQRLQLQRRLCWYKLNQTVWLLPRSQVTWTWTWLPWLCQVTPTRSPPCGGRCAALWGCSWRTPTFALCLPFSPVSLEPMMACW